MEQQKIRTRQEQKTEDTWNMQDLYENEELFSKDAEKLEELMEKFSSFQGSLTQGPGQLLKVMKLYEEMNLIFERLYVYANQKYHEDTSDAKYQQMSGEMQILSTQFGQACAWLEPELLALPGEVLDSYFCETEETDPDYAVKKELAGYSRFLKEITRRRDHVLDAQT